MLNKLQPPPIAGRHLAPISLSSAARQVHQLHRKQREVEGLAPPHSPDLPPLLTW